MKTADGKADAAVRRIEKRFADSNPTIAPALEKMGKEALSFAQEHGGLIGAALGGGIVAAFVNEVKKVVNALAEAGDKADELRLPINLIQAFRVAGDEARVSSDQIKDAFEKITEVSKKPTDDIKEFNKALGNIDEKLVAAFKNAPSQAERVRIISTALAATTDEVKRAQLGLRALGTDNERVTNLFAGAAGTGLDDYIGKVRRLGLEIDESAVKRAQDARSALSLLSRVMGDELTSALAQLIPTLREFLPYLERVAGAVRDTVANLGSEENRPLATLQNNLSDAEISLARFREELGKLDQTVPFTEGVMGKVAQAVEELGGSLKKVVDENGNAIGIHVGSSLDNQRAGIENDISTAEQLIERLKKLIAERHALEGAPPKNEPPPFKSRPGLGDDKDKGGKDQFEAEAERIRRHIALLNADAVAVGKTVSEHEKLRAELELLNGARKENDDITEKQIDTYTKLRATMSAEQALLQSGIKLTGDQNKVFAELPIRAAAAGGSLQKVKDQFAGFNEALKFGGNELVNVFDAIGDKSKKMSDVVASALAAVKRAALQAAITGEGPLAKILGLNSSVPGGTGGLLGSLAGAFGLGGARASGGPVSFGKSYLVGENGPELFRPSTSGYIVANGSGGGGGGGSSGQGGITIESHVHNNVGAAVSQQTTRTPGGFRIETVIDRVEGAIASRMAKGGSPLNLAAEGRYGLSPARGNPR